MFGTVDIDKCWYSQVCPVAIGGIITCHKMRHRGLVCLYPQSRLFETASTFSLWPDIVLSVLSADKLTRGSSVPLAKCSFGMIPLSRHSVDRSPRVLHSSTHNVVRASCFEVLSACVKTRSCFWMEVCVSRALAMAWMCGSNFLEAAICVAGNLSAYVGRGYPASAYKQGIGVSFKPVIILHISFRAVSKLN